MNIPSDQEVLEHIEAFLAETNLAPTRLGIEATGEGGLVKSIRDGRSLTLRTGRRLLAFMSDYRGGRAQSAGNSADESPSREAAA